MAEEKIHSITWLFLHTNLNQHFGNVSASRVSLKSSGATISNPAHKGYRDSGKERRDMTSVLQVDTLHDLDSFPQPFHKAFRKCYTLSIPVGSLCNELPLYPQLKLLRAGPCLGLHPEFLHRTQRTFNSRFSATYIFFWTLLLCFSYPSRMAFPRISA